MHDVKKYFLCEQSNTSSRICHGSNTCMGLLSVGGTKEFHSCTEYWMFPKWEKRSQEESHWMDHRNSSWPGCVSGKPTCCFLIKQRRKYVWWCVSLCKCDWWASDPYVKACASVWCWVGVLVNCFVYYSILATFLVNLTHAHTHARTHTHSPFDSPSCLPVSPLTGCIYHFLNIAQSLLILLLSVRVTTFLLASSLIFHLLASQWNLTEI